MRNSVIGLMILVLLGCQNDDGNFEPNNAVNHPNILFIIVDDLGKDAINGFTEGTIKPQTPHIDAIRNSGISFNNAWVYPTCTPTRASIITGKYGYSTGVKWSSDELSENETTLQSYISDKTNNTYSTALIGKWHLSGNNQNVNPESFGIDYYTGLIRGSADDYYRWQSSEDGNSSLQTTYITEYLTDKSIDWINAQTQPWFLWLAYTAPHTPFHVPPGTMHNQGNLPDYNFGMDATPYYMAAIEAMDYQIGRLIDSLSPSEKEKTVIIFLGDNGTPFQVAQNPYSSDKVKGTLYQGGINVPLFVSGNGISRSDTDENLITSTDLFATITELCGLNLPEINDSKSFKPLLTESKTIRTYQYSEMDDGTSDTWVISNGTYKLFKSADGDEELYNIINDPYETNNLIEGTLNTEANSAKQHLEEELGRIRQ